MGHEYKDLDKKTQKVLDELIQAMGHEHEDLDKTIQEKPTKSIPSLRSPRRRGRPPLGFSKAYEYTEQYWKLTREGVSPWRAVKQVAELYRKTPEHISACRKLIEQTDPMEYLVDDILDEMRIEASLRQPPED